MKIGELARRTGCGIETIRYYERIGVLPPPRRSVSNYRHYRESDVERLVFIRNCRSLDMTLDEIQELLKARETSGESCAGVNALLDEHIEHVAHRIGELRRLEQELHQIRSHCQHASRLEACGILNELDRPERLARAQAQTPDVHVEGAHPRVSDIG